MANQSVRDKTTAYGFYVKMSYEHRKKIAPTLPVDVPALSDECAEKWKVDQLQMVTNDGRQ